MKRLIGIAVVMAAALLGERAALAQGTTRTVVPLGFEMQEGDQHDPVFVGSQPRQQWFRSDYVAQAWRGPVLITEIAFRVNAQPFQSDFNGTMSRVEIQFGVTSRRAADLSLFWAENVGDTALVSFNQRDVQRFSPGGPGPNPFGLRFVLERPFYYDPASGNLMMQLHVTGGTGTRPIDAHGFAGGVEGAPIVLISPPTFPFPYPQGIVTEFTWTAVPEPSAGALMLLTLGVVFLKRRNSA